MLRDAVDGTGAVEPGRDGEPAGDSGRLEPAGFLHPPDVQLQMESLCCQGIEVALGAPGEVAAQVRFGVLTG
jgi:hypothetical protein